MIPLLWLSLGWEAGAARVSVAPPQLPVIVNCFFNERTVDKITSPLEAKALVLKSGAERVAIVVVDSCMMPRELIDQAKAQAAKRTGIQVERMLVAATHTHFAPAAMGCLGSDAQPGYAEFLAGKIAEAITEASARLRPAEVGSAAVEDREHTFNRRYLYRANAPLKDPFGDSTVWANMHPGYQNPAAVGPSGPVDPALTVLSVRSRPEGRPIALLANYSMHYFASEPLSSDYFGLFAAKMRDRMKADDRFVVMMSQGTSGDLMWMDYSRPKRDEITLESYTEGVAKSAASALERVRYQTEGKLAMEEVKATFARRQPEPTRLRWARELVATFAGGKPKTQTEIYAREQVFLAEEPRRELKLQALRVGELAIAALPNEVFAITGLKLKARSPLRLTMNITLANGADGYIPPPEQHELGGYTTWPARTAGLEVGAEPRIVESVLRLLELVTSQPRRRESAIEGDYSRRVRASAPLRYWPMDDLELTSAPVKGKRAYALEGIEGWGLYLMRGFLDWPTLDPVRTFTFWYWPAATRRWEHRAITCRAGRQETWTNGQANVVMPHAPCDRIELEGKVDGLAYYSRALSEAEIRNQANFRPAL